MASNLDKNIVKDISTKIISMSLNIDHYNKTNKDIIEEPLFSDFFDYFSKTRNIWIKTIESVLKNIEKETNTIDEDDKSDIAVLVVTDMLNYMYIYNIQYVFKQQLKNVDTSTARKNVEVLLENKINVVEFTIGNKINTDKIDITLITKIGFRQIITNIETDKAYTVIKPPGHISSILSSKFGGNRSRKYRKTRKSKKYKRSRKSRKLKKF
jgi:hypothetical protein